VKLVQLDVGIILMIGLMGISDASARDEAHILVWLVQLCVDCRKLVHHYIVTDLINALPGNSSVNTNTGNNRKETVFSMWSAPGERTEL
jgi:hypothetical protein